MTLPSENPLFSKIVTDIPEAMSIKFNNLMYELKQKKKKVISLSLGEAFFKLPLWPMGPLPYPEILHYSHSRGIPELRKKIGEYHQRLHGFKTNWENEILVTAGSKAALYMTLLSILNPGDEVLVPEPGWVSYPEQIRLCHGKPVSIPCDVPVGRYKDFIGPRTKAIIITSPHNPRGYCYRPDEIKAIHSLALEKNIWILSDEAYSEFVEDKSFISFGKLDPAKKNIAVFNSISKTFGISGWRLGYVISNPALIDRVLKVNQHLVTCPATILEYYVAHYFDKLLKVTTPLIKDVVALRAKTADYLTKKKISFLPGNSTFYFFISLQPSKLGSEEFCTRLLMEKNVCLVPGVGYGSSCDKFARLSVGTSSWADIKKGIDRTVALISATS